MHFWICEFRVLLNSSPQSLRLGGLAWTEERGTGDSHEWRCSHKWPCAYMSVCSGLPLMLSGAAHVHWPSPHAALFRIGHGLIVGCSLEVGDSCFRTRYPLLCSLFSFHWTPKLCPQEYYVVPIKCLTEIQNGLNVFIYMTVYLL